MTKPRVLIEVNGGLVTISVDGDVDIRAGDFDVDCVAIGTEINITPGGDEFWPIIPFQWDETAELAWNAQDPNIVTKSVVAMPEEE